MSNLCKSHSKTHNVMHDHLIKREACIIRVSIIPRSVYAIHNPPMDWSPQVAVEEVQYVMTVLQV